MKTIQDFLREIKKVNEELPGGFALLPPKAIREPTPEEEATSTFAGPKIPVFKDFIARPNQPVASFSPDDTIIGTKDPSSILNSNNRTINIHINGAQSPVATGQEVRRQLSSLA